MESLEANKHALDKAKEMFGYDPSLAQIFDHITQRDNSTFGKLIRHTARIELLDRSAAKTIQDTVLNAARRKESIWSQVPQEPLGVSVVLSFIAGLICLFISLFPPHYSGTIIGFIVCAGIVTGLVYILNKQDNAREIQWVDSSLENYQYYVPLEMLEKLVAIKEQFPETESYVRYLNKHALPFTQVHHYLMIKLEKEEGLLGSWSEATAITNQSLL